VQPKSGSAKLSALYYPYSRCVDLSALKLLALLYEEVVFVDPLEENFREFLLSSDKGCQFVPNGVRERWRENQDSWDLLREAGILRTVDPVPVIREHDKLLAASYAADMADDAFVGTAEREGKAAGPWKMLETRLPPSVNTAFVKHEALSERVGSPREKADHHVSSDYQIGVFAWEHYDHFGLREYVIEKLGGRKARSIMGEVTSDVRKTLDSSPLTGEEQLFLSGGGTCTKDGNPFGMHPYAYVDSVAFSTGEPIRILAFSQGSSLSISQALLLADLYGLTPVTDSPLHQRLLAMKYNRAIQNLPTDGSVVPQRSAALLERYSIVARRVLLETLPARFLSGLPVRDLLRYREANQRALDRFWLKIRDLSHELDDVGSEDRFEERVVKIIDRFVLPELDSVSNELKNSRRKMFGSLVAKLGGSIPVSTIISVFAGLSGGRILALAASAALAAFGMSLPSLTSYWQDKGKLGQNWLSFVVDLRGRS
jgi:hypothetical protein